MTYSHSFHSSSLTSSPDFTAIQSKLLAKNIRIRGLKTVTVADLGSDSDDEDFDVNSALEDAVEDGDYQHKEGEGVEDDDDDISTSDTDEVMKELEPESDMMEEEEEEEEEGSKKVREHPDKKDDEHNPAVRCNRHEMICRKDRKRMNKLVNMQLFVFHNYLLVSCKPLNR